MSHIVKPDPPWPAIAPAKTVRGARTRLRLVEAAATVFGEYGYSGARIADMVAHAGISHGNFYRHFQSKDEILLAVFEKPMAELQAAIGGQAEGEVSLADLVKVNTTYFRAYARHRHLMRVIREAAASAPEFARLWLGLRGQVVGQTVRWLESVQAAGLLEEGANLQLLAETIGAVTEHLSYTRVALASELPRPAAIDELGRAAGEAWFLILSGRERLRPG